MPTRRSMEVALGIIWRAPHVLICRRPGHKPMGGFWEFPGGKREPGETIEACVVRELHEELDVEVRPLSALRTVTFNYPKVRVSLCPFLCELLRGEPRAVECSETRWVEPQALKDFRFPPANAGLLEEVYSALTRTTRHEPVGGSK